MSPRIKRLRKISNPPAIKGLKPYGPDIDKQKSKIVSLLFEEYEALKLCDYDMYNHFDASVLMGVSRPTFTRIYSSARQKIADALVEGKQISIEGGKVYFDSDWYECAACNSNFNNPDKDKKITVCPLCGSEKIQSFDINEESQALNISGCEDVCLCPKCGFEKNHNHGTPCNEMKCEVCGSYLKRKGTPNC